MDLWPVLSFIGFVMLSLFLLYFQHHMFQVSIITQMEQNFILHKLILIPVVSLLHLLIFMVIHQYGIYQEHRFIGYCSHSVSKIQFFWKIDICWQNKRRAPFNTIELYEELCSNFYTTAASNSAIASLAYFYHLKIIRVMN